MAIPSFLVCTVVPSIIILYLCEVYTHTFLIIWVMDGGLLLAEKLDTPLSLPQAYFLPRGTFVRLTVELSGENTGSKVRLPGLGSLLCHSLTGTLPE